MGNRQGQRQRRKPGPRGFTPARRQRFLDALALTCNVTRAAAFAGLTLSSIYARRAKDPQFVAQWRDALDAGYDRLEAMVLEHGGAGVALESADPGRAEAGMAEDPPRFDFAKAMELLKHHRASRHRLPGARGKQRRMPTREETNAALAKAIAAAEKRLGRSDDA